MRGVARGLRRAGARARALAFVVAFAFALSPAFAAGPEDWVRKLDGAEFLEDEPVWICDESGPGGIARDGQLEHGLRLTGRTLSGATIDCNWAGAGGMAPARVGELMRTFGLEAGPDRFPLDVGIAGPIPAGRYELRRATGDTTRVLARFRITPPAGSERQVRAALARAARLRSPGMGRDDESARLLEAVLARYPRTGYRTAAYWGLWRVRGHTRYAKDPGRWLEEMFAHFHDTCFGVAAIDAYVQEIGPEESQPRLRRLVGLYPDTRMARAATRYLSPG